MCIWYKGALQDTTSLSRQELDHMVEISWNVPLPNAIMSTVAYLSLNKPALQKLQSNSVTYAWLMMV